MPLLFCCSVHTHTHRGMYACMHTQTYTLPVVFATYVNLEASGGVAALTSLPPCYMLIISLYPSTVRIWSTECKAVYKEQEMLSLVRLFPYMSNYLWKQMSDTFVPYSYRCVWLSWSIVVFVYRVTCDGLRRTGINLVTVTISLNWITAGLVLKLQPVMTWDSVLVQLSALRMFTSFSVIGK